MLVMTPAAPIESAALEHYQIIRRNGSVVPFEPSKIAESMMKAFMAIHGTSKGRSHLRSMFNELMMSGTGRSSIRLQGVWLFVLHLKHAMQAMLVGERNHAQSSGANRPLDGGKKQGFFSSSKPNLRNAP